MPIQTFAIPLGRAWTIPGRYEGEGFQSTFKGVLGIWTEAHINIGRWVDKHRPIRGAAIDLWVRAAARIRCLPAKIIFYFDSLYFF